MAALQVGVRSSHPRETQEERLAFRLLARESGRALARLASPWLALRLRAELTASSMRLRRMLQ